MSERVCPKCGNPVELIETLEDEQRPGSRMVYACTTEDCDGTVEEVSDEAAAEANEPTGGDNIGA